MNVSNYFNEIRKGIEEAIEIEENEKFLKELEDFYKNIDVDAIEELERANLMEYSKNIFLSSNERNNGKTYCYCMISKYHNIPVLVHDLRYKKDLIRKYGKDINIITPFEYEKYYQPSMKIIIDTTLAYSKLKYSTYVNLYNDDEIREIVLTDLSRGVKYE